MDTAPEENQPGAVTRRPLHHRRIDFHGYSRSDGLFEVEARLTDRKTYDFEQPADSRVVPAGQAIHDMGVTLVFGADMVIREVRSSMDTFPYVSCPGGGDTLQALVGVRIGAGFNGEVRKRLPACDTCAHLREIIAPMASAAFQTMTEELRDQIWRTDAEGRPLKIDTCHAYGRSRALVERLWPAHHEPAGEG